MQSVECVNLSHYHHNGNTPLPIQHLNKTNTNFHSDNQPFHFQWQNIPTNPQCKHWYTICTKLYANIFIVDIEQSILENPLQNTSPALWKRCIDDIFIIWPLGHTTLHQLLEHNNSKATRSLNQQASAHYYTLQKIALFSAKP